MNLEEYNSLPEIADMDFKMQSYWFQVRVDLPEDDWVERTLGRAAPNADGATRDRLAMQLHAVWQNFASQGDSYCTYFVRVPAESLQVVCWLRFGANYAFEEKSELFSPENYAAYMRKPDNLPGSRVSIIQVWRQEVQAGIAIGQYATVHYSNRGGGSAHVEERIAVGVFPTGAGQMLEFIYSTPYVGANTDHLVRLVQESIQTLTVELQPAGGAVDAS